MRQATRIVEWVTARSDPPRDNNADPFGLRRPGDDRAFGILSRNLLTARARVVSSANGSS
jgi:hypothetical protein